MRKALLGAVVAALLGFPAASAADLVMVERDDCSWCKRWHAEVGPAYVKTEEGRRAPLSRWRLEQGQPKLALKEPVRFTPTFILVEDGREIGRITGYLENGMFWGLLGGLLARLEANPAEVRQ
jgi:thioredoxin-related protein